MYSDPEVRSGLADRLICKSFARQILAGGDLHQVLHVHLGQRTVTGQCLTFQAVNVEHIVLLQAPG